MKKFLYLIALLILCGIQSMSAQGKQKISVLYVGNSTEIETLGGAKPDSMDVVKSAKDRMEAFDKFLKSRFKTVKVIDGKDYTVAMSDKYDVTIFDGKPAAIRPEIREVGPDGRYTRYERAAYLPNDFDRPALCIANASEEIGRSLGTKNDWFCLCLNDDAHHWVKDHAIFKGPFKVNIQAEMKPTPESALEYCPIYGYTLPKETEMWTVQDIQKFDKTKYGYRVGMVSRPWGYLDSPEAEIISSGVCAKSIDAVAIGRHANFFHWGFSASPAYLTEAGKAALANSIVYISKFAGQHIISRKLNEGIAHRTDAISNKYFASKECWKDYEEGNMRFYLVMDSIITASKAKLARGEELNNIEKEYASYPPMEKPKSKTYAEYLKERYPKIYAVFGDDAEEYRRYFDKNVKWFYPDESGYRLEIDEDVRTLGIANNDKQMLDACISLLEKNETPELATRILQRYTLCRFATAAEWRNWFNTYQDKMFFTESGGWLWLINTQDKNVPGNDYSVLKKTEEGKVPELSGDTDEQNPVALSAAVNTLKDGSKEIVLRMKIHPGYHTYAQVSEKDPFVNTKIELTLPDGYELDGPMSTPAVSKMSGSETTIYTGDGVFRQKIKGNGAGEVKCTVGYQCCNNTACLLPVEKELTINIQ